MAHGDSLEGKWRINWRMEWVASTLHTTSEHGVSSITTAVAAHLGLQAVDWTDAPRPPPPADLNGIVPYARKTKFGFCGFAIIFQLASTTFLYFFLCFVDRASRYICVIKTSLMRCLSSVYFVTQPLQVSGIFVAHCQEVYCIYTATGTCCAEEGSSKLLKRICITLYLLTYLLHGAESFLSS